MTETLAEEVERVINEQKERMHIDPLYVIDLLERIPNWQPIETAPKDGCGKGISTGTRGPMVLVSDGSGPYIAFWNGSSWDDGDYHDDLGEMTHWMPLPDPPSTKEERK